MEIPIAIKSQADFLLTQKDKMKNTSVENSKSLLTNVLDLNDELIFVAGEQFQVGSANSNKDSKSSLNSEKVKSNGLQDESNSLKNGIMSPFEHGPSSPLSSVAMKATPINNTQCCQYRTQVKYILKELQCLSNKAHSDDRKSTNKSEWQFAGRVIDRFCLFVFSFLVVAFTVNILIWSPNHWNSLLGTEGQ